MFVLKRSFKFIQASVLSWAILCDYRAEKVWFFPLCFSLPSHSINIHATQKNMKQHYFKWSPWQCTSEKMHHLCSQSGLGMPASHRLPLAGLFRWFHGSLGPCHSDFETVSYWVNVRPIRSSRVSQFGCRSVSKKDNRGILPREFLRDDRVHITWPMDMSWNTDV